VRKLKRDCGSPRAFANDDIDSEILHCQVEKFLCRSWKAMDLIEKKYFSLHERGKDRG